MTDTRWSMRPDLPKALMLAKRQLAEFVCDAVNLEGIPFTLPEIQTLLQGVTVGGHKISDQNIALNQGNAWIQLFVWIETGAFTLSKDKARALHALAAKDDALEWGRFMMNGHLLAHGYPAINLPAKRQLEFNTLMLALYDSGDESPMNAFLRSCLDPRVIAIMKE